MPPSSVNNGSLSRIFAGAGVIVIVFVVMTLMAHLQLGSEQTNNKLFIKNQIDKAVPKRASNVIPGAILNFEVSPLT